jgi:hypothetical protein
MQLAAPAEMVQGDAKAGVEELLQRVSVGFAARSMPLEVRGQLDARTLSAHHLCSMRTASPLLRTPSTSAHRLHLSLHTAPAPLSHAARGGLLAPHPQSPPGHPCVCHAPFVRLSCVAAQLLVCVLPDRGNSAYLYPAIKRWAHTCGGLPSQCVQLSKICDRYKYGVTCVYTRARHAHRHAAPHARRPLAAHSSVARSRWMSLDVAGLGTAQRSLDAAGGTTLVMGLSCVC